MTRLDSVIEKLATTNGRQLHFESGSGIVARTERGMVPLMKQPLSTQQIVGAFAEVVPSDMKSGFPEEGVTSFPYLSPSGPVSIRFEKSGDWVTAEVQLLGAPKPNAPPPKPEAPTPDVAPPAVAASRPGPAPRGTLLFMPDSKAAEAAPAVAAKASEAPAISSPEAEDRIDLASPAEMMGMAGRTMRDFKIDPAALAAAAKTRTSTPPTGVKAAKPRALELDEEITVSKPRKNGLDGEPRNGASKLRNDVVDDEATVSKPRRREAREEIERTAPAIRPGRPKNVVRTPEGQEMERLLHLMLERGASDIHLSSLNPPNLRIDGDIVPLVDMETLEAEHLERVILSIAPEKNRRQYDDIKDTDFAYELAEARFRVNVFEDRNGIGAVVRQIPNEIRSAEDMGLSKAVLDLCFLTKGLVLVTGPTGSGKSTTLAALIDYVNRTREDHIITIEDPIEFVHPNKKCLVNQREVGVNTSSFKHALRAALREDPDIVLVGEMRDLETIAIAIETAETGHLVFGTLHTNTAPSTVDRIIDQFPPDRQAQIRMMLSESLKGVISQTLCKKIGGGRVPAHEILLCTGSVANLIREGKTFQIASIMQTSRGAGMISLNDSLFELVKKKLVDPKEAYQKAIAKSDFKTMLERAGYKIDLHGPPA
jgi:twitching motility protein PilT